LGKQGIAQIDERITELLSAFLHLNTIYQWKDLDWKTIDITHCKACKKHLLAAECPTLVIYYYYTGKIRQLFESLDRPAGQPADNLSNPGGLGDYS
jgi:hypothetical protein